MRRKNKIASVTLALAIGAAFMILIGSSARLNAGDNYTSEPQENAEDYITSQSLTSNPVKPESVTVIDEQGESCIPESTYKSMIGSRDWDSDDSKRLMKIAMAEAESEGVKGKALVMLVVLNRVWSDDFPGTIEDVIFQPQQFSVVAEGGRYYTTEPDTECYEALELILSGWDESYGALYFESSKEDSWHSRNLEFLFQEGNHKFYK